MKVSSRYNIQIPKTLEENLEWRSRVFKKVFEEPSYINILKQCCKEDPLFYINGFGWTYDPRNEFDDNPQTNVPFILYPCQEDAILEFVSSFNTCDAGVEKSRDMGASWCCIIACDWAWHWYDGLSFLFASRDEKYVDKADNPKSMFWKLDYFEDHLPGFLQIPGYTKGVHRTYLHAKNPVNNSVIDGESTNKDLGSGDRRTAIILDEFSKVEQGHSILMATRPVSKCRIFNSTPNGINAFFDIMQVVKKKIRLHWTDHPVKSKGAYYKKDGKYVLIDKEYWIGVENLDIVLQQLDKKILDKGVPLPDEKIRSPWYAEQCERAHDAREIAQEEDIDYHGSGGQYFKQDAIQLHIKNHARPPLYVGDLLYDTYTGEPISFREDENGHLKIWALLDGEFKYHGENKIVCGFDISAGSGASNSTGAVWDSVTHSKIAEYANPLITPEDFSRQAVAISYFFNNAMMNWDNFGPGSSFGSKIKNVGYTNVYRRSADPTVKGTVSEASGYPMAGEPKTILMGLYRDALEKNECQNCSKISLEECLEYNYGIDGTPTHVRASNKEDPSGAKKNHGDRVIADALAWKMMTMNQILPKAAKETEPPIGSLAWRNKMREQQKQKPRSSCYW